VIVDKTRIVLEIVTLLQGTPLDDFARHNLAADGSRAVVRCAERSTLPSTEAEICKRSIATALLRYSYRFTQAQLGVLADLYVSALDHLEPQALGRIRERMCDPASEEAQRDAPAARAVCERLSIRFLARSHTGRRDRIS
jgi:hypothetical protein